MLHCGICCGITSDTVGVGVGTLVVTAAKRAKRRLLICNEK